MIGRAWAAAAVALAVLLAGCSSAPPPDPRFLASEQPDEAGLAYLQAWDAGDAVTAARRTTAPEQAQPALEEVRQDLQVTDVRTSPGAVTEVTDGADGRSRAALPFRAALELEGLGPWEYEGKLPLVRTDTGWLVDWSPTVLHPQLTPENELVRERTDATATTVLDIEGRRLMYPRPVVEVAIRPDKLTDPAAAYRVLDKLGRDAAKARAQVAKAAPTAVLPQITVRAAQFEPYAAEARKAGLVLTETTRTLADNPTFAKPVLEAALAAGDPGVAGGGQVRLVPRKPEAPDAAEPVVLHRFPAPNPPPLRTTLDSGVQKAAEAALAKVTGKAAALVAVDAATGEVRASASRDASGGATSFHRAFVGRYPPGSTFKVVTASALLENGLDVDDPVECAQFIRVLGKRFQNVEEFKLGTVPFRRVFAQSCNTGFIEQALKLPEGALREEASSFGLGQEWNAGVPTFSGSMREPVDKVEQAANAIGQGTVIDSPLGMAVVAATAASGTYRSPRLLLSAPPSEEVELPKGRGAALRTLMREVVEKGSARGALGSLAGAVGAKTGTAEFSTQQKPGTHAWIIGYRGDLAFAVLIENGGGGGANAGPIAKAFLQTAPQPKPSASGAPENRSTSASPSATVEP